MTTFVTLGLLSSARSWMRRNSVVICRERSLAKGATSSSMERGSSSGSSPCTLTTMSQSSDAATSARRSVPVVCVALVSRALPPKSCTRVAMRRSSVATMTSDRIRDAATRRYTCSIIGRPSRSASALPGSRVEAYRAGMRATMVGGGTESRGAELADEIARLHERLRPVATPRRPARNLFAYRAAPATAPTAPAPTPALTAAPAPVPLSLPALKLAGIAEDNGADGPERTAFISGEGQLFMVKEGETVTQRYRVTKISADVVELIDLTDDTLRRLALR